jgi:hypothetical protein
MFIQPSTARWLALAGLALALPPVSHATLNYQDGDLLLAFRATGGVGANTDYIVNVGSAAMFVNATDLIVLDLEIGNILADLNSLYTTDWDTRGDVLWSLSGVQKVAGNGFPTNTMFATNLHTGPLTLGTQGSTAWARPSAFGAGAVALKIQSMGTEFARGDFDGTPSGTNESTNSLVALLQPVSAANSYRSFMPGGVNTDGSSAFGYFLSATGIEGNFAAGTSGVALDLYRIEPGSGASVFEGNFTLSDNATVTFTPTGVPEPSSLTALGLGVAVLGAVRRRQRNS